jgi:putative transcriptional regulator
MDSSLRERVARLGRVQAVSRAESGSPATLLIEWAGDIRDIQKIPAIEALAHRWMPKLRAMRAVDAMVGDRKAYVYVPKVESLDALTQELATAGVKATALPNAGIDVRAMRETLDLTQEQFAVRYGLDVDAVRNWETGRRTPDTAAQSYLRAIRGNPEAVETALWSDAAGDEHRGNPSPAAQVENRVTASATENRAATSRPDERVTASAAAQCVTPSAA